MLNPYFTQGRRSEQLLYEDLIIESLKVFGQDVYYLPRTVVNKDTILGDDIPSTYGSAYCLEMYLENTDGFDGDGDLFTKFGVEIRDQANFVCSRRRFKHQIGSNQTNGSDSYYRPKEGDLIYLALSGSLFQINYVEDESPFYQLKNLPVFRMTCQLFEYNDEDLDTNIAAIDNLEKKFSYQYALTLDSSGNVGALNKPFEVGEQVVQTLSTGVEVNGEVQSFSDSDNILYLAHVGANDGLYHSFTTSINVVGLTSTAYSLVTAVNEVTNNVASQNAEFDDFESGFIDFSEGNPFGDAE